MSAAESITSGSVLYMSAAESLSSEPETRVRSELSATTLGVSQLNCDISCETNMISGACADPEAAEGSDRNKSETMDRVDGYTTDSITQPRDSKYSRLDSSLVLNFSLQDQSTEKATTTQEQNLIPL